MGASLFGGLFWLFLASLLSVADYGLTNYFIALASIASTLALMGLDATVITFLAKGEKMILIESNFLTLLSGVSVTIILSFLNWSVGLLSIAMVFFMMSLAETLGKKDYREYAFLSVGQKIVQIALSIALYFPLGLIGVVLGYFFGNLVFSYKYIKWFPKFSLQTDSIKEKRKFTLHSYGNNLIRSFTNYLDKIIIAPVFGYYILGLYQLGFQFFMFLSIIPLSLYYYLLPEESSGNNKTQIKYVGFGFALFAAAATFLATRARFFFGFDNYCANNVPCRSTIQRCGYR
jgi:O-antigen/teichoic acid export membrane protein